MIICESKFVLVHENFKIVNPASGESFTVFKNIIHVVQKLSTLGIKFVVISLIFIRCVTLNLFNMVLGLYLDKIKSVI